MLGDRRLFQWSGEDTPIDGVVREPFQYLVGGQLRDNDAYIELILTMYLHQLWQEIRGDGGNDRQAEDTLHNAFLLLNNLFDLVQLCQSQTSLIDQPRTYLRGLHRQLRTVEQFHAKLLLQLLYHHAQCGLRNK